MVLGILTTPILTRLVDPAEYGRFSIFLLYIKIATMVFFLGLDQALVRFYYKSESLSYKKWLVSSCGKIPFGFSFVVLVFLYFLLVSTSIHFEFRDTFSLLAIGIYASLIFRLSTLVVRLDNKNKVYSLIIIVNKVVYIILSITLILLPTSSNFINLAIAHIAGLILASIIAIAFTREKFSWNLEKSITYNQDIQELIKYGLPFIISMGITTLFQSIDKLFLKFYCDYATVGVYASAASIVSIFSIIQTTFNTIWGPMMVRHFEKDKDDLDFFVKYNSIISFVMLLFGLTLVLCKDIFGFLLGEKYREAAYIVPFLTLEPIMYTVSETTSTGIVLKNKSYMNIVVGGVACISNAVGNYFLIPILGAKGAAISTGGAYIVFFLLRTIIGNQYLKVNFRLVEFIAATVIYLLFASLNSFITFGIWTVAVYLISVVIVVFLYRDVVRLLIERLLDMFKRYQHK